MKTAIFYNPKTNPENKKYALKVTETLHAYKQDCLLNPKLKDLGNTKIAIAVGGDGTVLYTANLLSKTKIPILGINFGHIGYLCQAHKNDFDEKIQNIIKGNFVIEEKTRIQAEIRKQKNPKIILDALNEISIGGINRTVHLNVEIITPKRNFSSQITGDGLIVATQTGSTAYNINAGGPILLTEAFSVVANNAFFCSDALLSATKSLVVPSETIIKVNNIKNNPANLPYVIADGQKAVRIELDDLIIIAKSKNKNYFISFHE